MEGRIRRAMTEVSTVIPQMSCSPKDHKPLPDSGVPKTRPLMNASASMNQRISDVFLDLLTYLFMSEQETAEVISTEDFLSKIEAFNDKIRQGKTNDEEIMVGSLDVEALYPSIDVDLAASIVKAKIMESPLKMEGVDWRWDGCKAWRLDGG